jgi:maleate isomerase
VALVEAIGKTLYDAVDRCMTCEPDYLIMGMSALMFWDGAAPRKSACRSCQIIAG